MDRPQLRIIDTLFDLRAVLPELLPSAIAWAEAHAAQIARDGRHLDPVELQIATRVGVEAPELIALTFVDRLTLPTEPMLREAAIATGLLGPNRVGLTLGHGIYIVEGHLDVRLLSHECRHVHQYEAYGSIAAFLPVYLLQIATVGYSDALLEIDARNHELR